MHEVSEQTRMELLVADMHLKENLKDAQGEFLDLYEWEGLVFSASGNVQKIHFAPMDSFANPEGSVDFRWLPTETVSLTLIMITLSGSLEAVELPRTLEMFTVSYNMLVGTVDWKGLPPSLLLFDIERNRFEGSLWLRDVPSAIEKLAVSGNNFSGTLDWGDCPRTLTKLYVGNNNFYGPLNIHALPDGMESFDASWSKFSGSLDLSKLPKALVMLDLAECLFSQNTLAIDIDGHENVSICVDMGKFANIVDLHGRDIRDRISE